MSGEVYPLRVTYEEKDGAIYSDEAFSASTNVSLYMYNAKLHMSQSVKKLGYCASGLLHYCTALYAHGLKHDEKVFSVSQCQDYWMSGCHGTDGTYSDPSSVELAAPPV